MLKNPIFDFYVSKHNQGKLLKIKSVNIDNYNHFVEFVSKIEKETSWKVYITSTHRTFEEQARLKRQDSRNASPGNSKYNYAKAIDIVLYQNTFWEQNWIEKRSEKKRWLSTKVVDVAKKHSLTWGGNFSKYYDPVHFEID
ncbi:MAG: M15 family metallopeptidase [Arcicella sp.]|nr:M15 family metallopeptidase [Arcicella sp.]